MDKECNCTVMPAGVKCKSCRKKFAVMEEELISTLRDYHRQYLEIKELQKDKDRLDYLEDRMKNLEWCCDDHNHWYELVCTMSGSEEGKTIREVIDKARN